MENLGDRTADERRAAGEHLEQDRAGGEAVGPRIDRLAVHLLGRHVPRRPHHDAAASQADGGLAGLLHLGPGQSEIEQLDAVARDEHVGRLEIAMDDAARVDRAKRGEHLRRDRYRLGDAERAARQPLGERLAFEQFHREEQVVAILADVVDLADVRMIDARGRARLPPQSLPGRLVLSETQNHLQRDGALQALVVGLVDDPHPAGAQLSGDPVVRDSRWRVTLWLVAAGCLRGRRAFQPPVEAAQPSCADVVDRVVRHGPRS